MQANRESVRAFLLQPHFIRQEFGELFERRALLSARATKTTAQLTGMPGGGGSDREELYAALVDTNYGSICVLRDYARAATAVELLLNDAPLSVRQKNLLDARYKAERTWREIIKELGMSERNTFYEHTKALDVCADYINQVNPWYWEDVNDCY